MRTASPAAPTAIVRPGAAHPPDAAAAERILTPEALAFVAELERGFRDRRQALLRRRAERRRTGAPLGFLEATRDVRESAWRVAAAPPALERRHVEITGPADRKMMINALNSGADGFMVDFEDALAPTWANVVEGQANVADAVRGRLAFTAPDGREYRLAERTATLLVRPRGWHLEERHLLVDGAPVSASLADFGLAFFHNAREQLDRGAGPYYYLPKLESHLEARLWRDVFAAAEGTLGLPAGSVRATVLVETLPAAFEMDEILFELRDYAAGLNAGRWDYLFSVIKTIGGRGPVLPDRAQLTMAVPFMRAYAERLVAVCHRRGAHAMGGMAAFVPNRRDPAVTAAAIERVRADKEREAAAGFDGTWVAHPDLVPVAAAAFTARLGDRPHQKDVAGTQRAEPDAARALTDVAVEGGRVTLAGVRTNVRVALWYVATWLGGDGAVAIDNLMEDAATAEISRAQLWQWVRLGAPLADGESGSQLTPAVYHRVRDEELAALRRTTDPDVHARLDVAAGLLDDLVLASECAEFLTIAAYERLER